MQVLVQLVVLHLVGHVAMAMRPATSHQGVCLVACHRGRTYWTSMAGHRMCFVTADWSLLACIGPATQRLLRFPWVVL